MLHGSKPILIASLSLEITVGLSLRLLKQDSIQSTFDALLGTCAPCRTQETFFIKVGTRDMVPLQIILGYWLGGWNDRLCSRVGCWSSLVLQKWNIEFFSSSTSQLHFLRFLKLGRSLVTSACWNSSPRARQESLSSSHVRNRLSSQIGVSLLEPGRNSFYLVSLL